ASGRSVFIALGVSIVLAIGWTSPVALDTGAVPFNHLIDGKTRGTRTSGLRPPRRARLRGAPHARHRGEGRRQHRDAALLLPHEGEADPWRGRVCDGAFPNNAAASGLARRAGAGALRGYPAPRKDRAEAVRRHG